MDRRVRLALGAVVVAIVLFVVLRRGRDGRTHERDHDLDRDDDARDDRGLARHDDERAAAGGGAGRGGARVPRR